MAEVGGHILVVDDNPINRMTLKRALIQQGHRVSMAENGRDALEMLRAHAEEPYDLVLLDILMPEMDGYQVLEQIKKESGLHHLPVIMISALDEMDSVLRCIEMGATDYLPKPFNPALLQARLNASLVEKRLRDLELEYLEQAGLVARAAQAVETGTYDPQDLNSVAARSDALGQLARVFQRMAREVHLREQHLKLQLRQLQLDIDEMKKALVEPLCVYIPMDRRQAMVMGTSLPDRSNGAALFADISGFTPLTAALAQELGLQRGAEELTRILNQVYSTLIDEVHRFGGSVVNFSGDAVTCWLDGDDGLRAVACGLEMQKAMIRFKAVETPGGGKFSLAIKVAIVSGPVRRFLVGDPLIQYIDVLAGRTLDELAEAEHHARRGEVLVQAEVVSATGDGLIASENCNDERTGKGYAVISGLKKEVKPMPWQELPADCLDKEQCHQWLLPAVYERVKGGTKQFLAELRPAVALFLCFQGINYDEDEQAGTKLDEFVRRVQLVIQYFDGILVQLTIGDKGSYLYAAFGAPVAHKDDAVRAANAALALLSLPAGPGCIRGVKVGLALGQMRSGAYGSPAQRTYGVLGEKTNLAARLMQFASDGVLCDEAVYLAAKEQIDFETLPAITIKGVVEPVAVYHIISRKKRYTRSQAHLIDRLSAHELLVLKVASVLGRTFSLQMLTGIYPDEEGKVNLEGNLQALEQMGLIRFKSQESAYIFRKAATREIIYGSMLFAQRRQLHRLVAEWYERVYSKELSSFYDSLAYHWREADEPAQAVDYLEKAGQQALRQGKLEEAERFFKESLELDQSQRS